MQVGNIVPDPLPILNQFPRLRKALELIKDLFHSDGPSPPFGRETPEPLLDIVVEPGSGLLESRMHNSDVALRLGQVTA